MRFRDHCNNIPVVLMESKKFMAHNATLRQEITPLPGPMDFSNGKMPKNLKVCVTNVLNKLPVAKRPAALQWIMGDAAQHAAVQRTAIADWAKQELWNRFHFDPQWDDITWEEAVFNTQAYEEVPQLGKIADEIEQKWFTDPDNEPDIIPLKDARSSEDERGAASLKQINAMLLKAGQTPLVYGGPDGYLSYIEKGSWNNHRISRAANFGNQGHDMSVRRTSDHDGKKTDPVSKTQIVSLGNATKPFNGDDKNDTGDKFQGGYNPLYNLSTLDTEISRSERITRRMLDKIAAQIENGEQIDQFSHPDIAFLKSMIKDGKLNPDVVHDEEDLLSAIIGLNGDVRKEIDDETGELVSWIRVTGTDEHYANTKASVKASLEYLMKLPPGEKSPGSGFANDHSSNPWPWASIRIPGADKIDLNPEIASMNVDDPEVQKKIVDRVMALIFNDENRTCMKRIYIRRNGVGGVKKYTKFQKNNTTIDTKHLIVGKNGTIAKRALSSRGDTPIAVEIDGKVQTFDPKELIGDSEGSRKFKNRNYKFAGEFAPIFMQSELQKSYTKEELQKLIDDNHYQISGNGKTFVSLSFKGSSDNRKFVKLVDGKWGEIVTSQGKPVSPTSLKPLDKYNTVAIGMLNGKEILVKKIKTPDGKEQWIEMPPGVETDDIKPILASINTNFNVTGGIRDKMEYPPERQEKEWSKFMNNLEKYNDTYDHDFQTAESIAHGVRAGGRNRKNYDMFELKTDAEMSVRSHIANQSFRYGTPEILQAELHRRSTTAEPKSPSIEKPSVPTTPAAQSSKVQPSIQSQPQTHASDEEDDMLRSAFYGESMYFESEEEEDDMLMNAIYSDDSDTNKTVIDLYKKVVFGLAGDVEAHDGPPKKVGKVLYVSPEILDAILQSGYIWRKRKAASAAVAAYNRSIKPQSTGTGGGSGSDGEEMDHWANVTDDNDDDEFSRQAAIDSGESDYDDNRGGYSGSYDPEKSNLSSFDIGGNGEKDSVDAEIERLEADKAKRKKGEFVQPSSQSDYGQPEAGPKGTKTMVTRGYSSNRNMPLQPTHVDTTDAEDAALRAALYSGPDDTSDMDNLFGTKKESFKGYAQWLSENEAVYDPKVKIKDGCGFNWWGAAGNPLGVSISGKADSSKSDPTGKEKIGKSRTPRK